ncbi:flagellar hook-length control protein FliK [Methylorubrum sp. B1-46]|uniref:flagellar hook-length control protein FliK n=1 Tax=Methylorubrum sp. B1-46 TaxID=2897334 RepID=UPI001E3974A2|nr:flagellar hook-length control protein FliK [Methylorubrum sp. B1-46]UGB25326.1 flagellar hook-length control protein FliK [Methylorubrum sp. B1-46]
MVSRSDLAEVWFRQVPRPASSAARGSEGTPRFSLEAAERKPAAPVRPAARRDETASARSDAGRADKMTAARAESAAAKAARTEAAKTEALKTEALKTEATRTRTAKADAAESGRAGASPENRAQSTSARNKPPPSVPTRDGTDAASARAPGAADSASQGPDSPAEGETIKGAAQEAAAEGVAAQEAGAVVLSEDETRDETDAAAPDALDPAALLSPPPAPPPPIPARPAATTDGAADEGRIGAGEPVAGGPGEAAATGQAAKADAAAASASAAAGTAGFETALNGTQTASAPAPTGVAGPLPPHGSSGLGAAQGAQAAQATDAAAAAAPPATPPIPLGAVPMTIGLRSLSGMNRFAIRLDPVELGRIDVSLDLDKAGGKARAHLVVDRPETLALLQRDAGSLQQALAQAGFDVGAEAGGIDLSLRGETGSQGGRDGESAPRGGSDRGPGGRDDGPASLPAPLDPASLRRLRAVSGLDIRI